MKIAQRVSETDNFKLRAFLNVDSDIYEKIKIKHPNNDTYVSFEILKVSHLISYQIEISRKHISYAL